MNTVRVKTRYGRLVGHQLANGAAFLGIRYAESPTGERRFLPPIPRRVAPEAEVLALESGAAPPQPVHPAPLWGRMPEFPKNEDCLNLSVFTPGPDDERRPVLVHLFGGGFEGGSATGGLQDGSALAARGNCVVVRLNFRVGALGFLYLGEAWGEPYQAGNIGLLDVVAALEWVQDNIRFLGGNPDNVTLFGVSSGAFMIASLFGVANSKNLFHRAWMQSGSASRILNREVSSQQTLEFLEILGIRPGDKTALQTVAVGKILEAQGKIVAQDVGLRNAPGGRTLGVVDDGVTLVEHPLAVLRRGQRREVPLLLGTTRDETRLWFSMGLMQAKSYDELGQECERFAGTVIGPQLFEFYRSLYPEANPAQLREKFLTDAIYRIPALRTATAQNQAGGQAYVYRFDWESPIMNGAIGATHALDEAFVWGVTDQEKAGLVVDTPQTRELADQLMTALFQFAYSGNPGWPIYTPNEPTTRLFGAAETLGNPDSLLLEAWEGQNRR